MLSVFAYLVYDTFFGPHVVWDDLLELNKWIERSGDKGIVMLIFLTLLGVPATIFIIGGGFAFSERYGKLGILYNFLACYVGCTIGGCCAFFLGRYFFRRTVRAYIRKKKMRIVRAIDIAMKREGTKMAILLRIVPYIPWNVFNYIAGVTGMRFYSYLIGSIGAWPWIIICSFIGSGLNSLDEAASGTSGGSNDKTNTILLIVGLSSTIITTVLVSRYARNALEEIKDEERMSRISESSFVFTEDGGSRQVSTASGMRSEGGMTKSEEGYWKEGQAAPLIQNV
ncbi:hypothetical protein TL16_g06206 [Triparma laevis f. inornata]|uniref:VTT domain-containing protein n=1 Tax=Triparma laevis f. inornata TaxID=1714386 RepID=A0A9W7ECZ3_9STRA|nr:hypothetical protein TL16_g06206 [Triparma laevis f. inornata]